MPEPLTAPTAREREPIDELREKLLEVAGWNCPPCQWDEPLTRAEDGRWWHEVDRSDDDEDRIEHEECNSHDIHEALYQYDKALAARRQP
jgi:hypothetical protein